MNKREGEIGLVGAEKERERERNGELVYLQQLYIAILGTKFTKSFNPH